MEHWPNFLDKFQKLMINYLKGTLYQTVDALAGHPHFACGGDGLNLLVTACITSYGCMTAITATADAPEQQNGNQKTHVAIVGVPAHSGVQAVPF
ncbi:hypothetical protein cyc_00005 [Cyclospora cayetanensis]|uniref:Uncharacterized protein n=1 Tax=Cyclospora cayetanensis TaxID=88456 RepID=A0A1D3D199_9EIME|nr:hypothetical protein cyc_00005 [Cyclospora cayetanensis]